MAAILVVLFWAVMSGLLVRDVYYPEASRFAQVPPRVVLDLFLRQSAAFGSTLHLYHHREKIGRATFQINRRIRPDSKTVYDVLAHGVVEREEGAQEGRHVEASWSASCVLADAERWQQLTLAARFPARDVSLKLSWDEKQPTPELLVQQGERVMMNSQDVKNLMSLGSDGVLSLFSALSGRKAAPNTASGTQLQAREGLLLLAGRERKCFVLVLPILGQDEVKMIFTEAGELARIDLPDGYALLEPLIHGLQTSTP